MLSKNLKNKIASLPEQCGVYLFKDKQGLILYVGKAKSLRKRVRSYFSRFLSCKTQAMVSRIADIEYILTPSESQAQIKEDALIKEHLPPYNISLRDDKSFPLIRISDEEFPAVYVCRRRRARLNDSSLYFGPYPSSNLLRSALKTIRHIFTFRSCKKMPKQACLYLRLNLCPGPCIGKINATQYKEIIERIKMFLNRRYESLTHNLFQKMQALSREKRFEEAANLRNQLNALSLIWQNQAYEPGLDELEDLKNLLRLQRLPLHIEAFDISNISGQLATGSMVSFYKGLPDKNNYRRFRIKSVVQIDDYKMMLEVLQRRYLRLIKEKLPLPDLILIDGGKAHLMLVKDELNKLGIDIPLVSIAKDKENIYIENKRFPIRLRFATPALNLIRRIRDEAHRFARQYHLLLRRKKMLGQ